MEIERNLNRSPTIGVFNASKSKSLKGSSMEKSTRAKRYAEKMKKWQAPEQVQSAQQQQFEDHAKQILIMRYLQDMTPDQVAQALDITRAQVRQIESTAIGAIRANSALRTRALEALSD